MTQNDRDYFLIQVQNGYGLQYIPHELKDDKEIALLAVERYFPSFTHISERLKMDPDIAMCLVQKNGLLLGELNPVLRNNEKIVLTAIQNNPWAYEYASEILKKKRNIAMKAIQKNGLVVVCLDKDLKGDRYIIQKGITYGCSLKYVPNHLRRRKYIQKALSKGCRLSILKETPCEKDRGMLLYVCPRKNRPMCWWNTYII